MGLISAGSATDKVAPAEGETTPPPADADEKPSEDAADTNGANL